MLFLTERSNLLIYILSIGVFGILNTEMGFIGILPLLADQFHVSISQAGLLISLFALVVAISGPTMPLLFSSVNRKTVMLLVLGVFILGNIVSIFASNFTVALLARVVPAFFHPVYCSLAFTVAAASVSKEEAPKAVSKVFVGVSGGMVLGVPVSSFIAGNISLEMAMVFFAVINIAAFAATILFVPSMPVKERLSYGTQVSVLKKPMTWISIIAVILMNGAVFGVFSYWAKYLEIVTKLSWNTISFILFIYGLATVFGSIVAGRLLSRRAIRVIIAFPFALGIVYSVLFLSGQLAVFMVCTTLVWGILGGIGGNINQYWISTAAPEAPDFANGLFLTAANLGTTLGTTVCGFVISQMGIEYIMFGGLFLSALSTIFIIARIVKNGNWKKNFVIEHLEEKELT